MCFNFCTCFISLCFVGITSFAVGIKLCAITARIKTYESIKIKKKEKRHDKIGFLGKDKLNSIEVLISKALIDLCISHNDIVSVVRKILQTIVKKTTQIRIKLLSNCGICGKNKSTFIKNQVFSNISNH